MFSSYKTAGWVILFLAFFIATLAYFSKDWFIREGKPALHNEKLFQKLGIEKAEKRIVAPDFTLEDLSGSRLSLSSFKGKVVFVNFWATWCVPCRQEMPTMERLHRELQGRGLAVIAVNFREGKKEVKEFFAELGLTFPVLLDPEGEVSEKYGAWSLPLSYFIDRKGEFVGKVVGYRKWDSREARAFMESLLG